MTHETYKRSTEWKLTPTQRQVMEYIFEFGSIVPARMGGNSYQGAIFGSETTKRCRELRNFGLIESTKKERRMGVFTLKEPVIKSPEEKEKERQEMLKFSMM